MNLKREYSINDFFNLLFKQLIPLCKQTYKPLLILLVPTSVIMGIAIAGFYKDIFALLPAIEQSTDMNVVNQLLFSELKLFGMAMISGLAGVAGIIIIISTMSKEILPENPERTPLDAVKTFFPRVLGALLIQGLIFLGLTIVFMVLIGLFAYLSQTIGAEGLFILLIVLLVLAYIGASIWMFLSFSFSPFHIVMEDMKAWESIKASVRLVKKQWWRLFGITFLFSMILSFALSMVTSPLVFLGIMPSFSNILTYSTMNSSVDEVEMLLAMVESLQSGSFIVIMSLVSLLQSFVQLVFMTLFRSFFFTDLKIKKKEWTPGEAIES